MGSGNSTPTVAGANPAQVAKDIVKNVPLRRFMDKMGIRMSEAAKLYEVFRDIDSNGSDGVDIAEFLGYFKIDNTEFTRRAFRLLSFEATNRHLHVSQYRLNWEEFFVSLYNYGTLTHETLVRFSFHIISGGQLVIYKEDILRFNRMLYSDPYKIEQATEAIMRVIHADSAGQITLESFAQAQKSFSTMLYPAFTLQRQVRSRVLSKRFWESATRKRRKAFGQSDYGSDLIEEFEIMKEQYYDEMAGKQKRGAVVIKGDVKAKVKRQLSRAGTVSDKLIDLPGARGSKGGIDAGGAADGDNNSKATPSATPTNTKENVKKRHKSEQVGAAGAAASPTSPSSSLPPSPSPSAATPAATTPAGRKGRRATATATPAANGGASLDQKVLRDLGVSANRRQSKKLVVPDENPPSDPNPTADGSSSGGGAGDDDGGGGSGHGGGASPAGGAASSSSVRRGSLQQRRRSSIEGQARRSSVQAASRRRASNMLAGLVDNNTTTNHAAVGPKQHEKLFAGLDVHHSDSESSDDGRAASHPAGRVARPNAIKGSIDGQWSETQERAQARAGDPDPRAIAKRLQVAEKEREDEMKRRRASAEAAGNGATGTTGSPGAGAKTPDGGGSRRASWRRKSLEGAVGGVIDLDATPKTIKLG